ncbi:MAG: DUF721 domain-containing protein [Proteobacteria bacterium]|nr:DUF721 domain-containing protein [Pseudomonadota bacterium]MBU1739622.1 DUF721 domain-containing protein [Pseudomonadota bacterium]
MMNDKQTISILGQIVKDICENRNWQEKLERHRVFSFWTKAVGQLIASHASPRLLRNTVLWVDVSDSVWMQQLHFQKTEMLESINARLHGVMIEDIRFQLASFFTPGKADLPTDLREKISAEPDPIETLEFDKMTSAIPDENIRQSMKKLWMAQKLRPK